MYEYVMRSKRAGRGANLVERSKGIVDIATNVLAHGHVLDLVDETDDAGQGVSCAPCVFGRAPSEEGVEFPI